MWYQFFLENVHFALNFLMAFALFAMAWLYFDAWLIKKGFKESLKIAGLVLLSLSFVLHAAFLETTVVSTSLLGQGTYGLLMMLTRIPGYLFLIAGLLLDPLQPKPETHGLAKGILDKDNPLQGLLAIPLLSGGISASPVFYPLLAGAASLIYLRRATIGLENHLKPVVVAFYSLSLFELMSLRALFVDSGNVDVARLAAPFGFLWIGEHALLLVSTALLMRWVWRYLHTRFQSQLFMIYTATILVIFLLTTVSFTGLLLKNLQDETLNRLKTDVKVLSFALESKKSEVLSDAEVFAQGSELAKALVAGARPELGSLTQRFILTKKQSGLVVVSDKGQVLARGEDRERIGDSLSDDALVERALFTGATAGVVAKDGVLAPEIVVRAAVPVKSEGKVIGAVVASTVIDNAFVDGVKRATDLETVVFGESTISASTLTQGNRRTRLVGLKETGTKVISDVLKLGREYTGNVTLADTGYFGAYLPLLDIDQVPIGMLFVGKPQAEVLRSAGRSIELTFLVAIGLIVFSILPAYLVSRYLSYQLS